MADPARWERLPDESAKAYQAFRAYRDLGVTRSLAQVASSLAHALRYVEKWSATFDWVARVQAWDDESHRVEDVERLNALRSMHANHWRAGRAAMRKALLALESLPVDSIPAGAAARLLELGARLERSTLTVSVEDLQGIAPDPGEDPWERIARELTAATTGP